MPFDVDFWLLGHRGNDYNSHRRRLNSIIKLNDKDLFIAGCGRGDELNSWLRWKPRSINAVDYFNYEQDWNDFKKIALKRYPSTSLHFEQKNLTNLANYKNASFDVIGSDAVLEHLNCPITVFQEFYRLLKPGGVLYGNFGPLWYSWHGDHLSGIDCLENGYNHLLLGKNEYLIYKNTLIKFNQEYSDSINWASNNMFSHFRPVDYVTCLEDAGFKKTLIGLLIEPKALNTLQKNKEVKSKLLKITDFISLVSYGMTIIFTKPC